MTTTSRRSRARSATRVRSDELSRELARRLGLGDRDQLELAIGANAPSSAEKERPIE